MKKRLWCTAALFLGWICSAAVFAQNRNVPGNNPRESTIFNQSAEEAFRREHWITVPREGELIVIGIAGRKARKEEAIKDALADAARRVSLYYGVIGEFSAVLQEGSNVLDYYAKTDYTLDIAPAEAYTGALVFDPAADICEYNGSVYVRARYGGISGIPSAYSAGTSRGGSGSAPDWVIRQNLDISGFLVGVGNSKNRGSPQRTWQASYENAIASLLPQLFTQVEESVIDTGSGGKITRNVSVSRGRLASVIILETWFDTKTGTVWTLVAARME